MKRYAKILKITLIILPVMVLASFIGTSFVYSDDSNRYRDDSSSVFAPGYLNAAKYQAEAIMNQQAPKKSVFGNILDFMQVKTEDKVEKANTDKVETKPKLQQKQSSAKGKTNTQSAAAIVAAAKANPADIPANIRNKVQEYINQAGSTNSNHPYNIISAGEKYYVVWDTSSVGFTNYIRAQIFNTDGTAAFETQFTLTNNMYAGSLPYLATL